VAKYLPPESVLMRKKKMRAYRFVQILSGAQAFESRSDECADKWIQ
jgi:hypothetical protein